MHHLIFFRILFDAGVVAHQDVTFAQRNLRVTVADFVDDLPIPSSGPTAAFLKAEMR
jgi:hypothetical protein